MMSSSRRFKRVPGSGSGDRRRRRDLVREVPPPHSYNVVVVAAIFQIVEYYRVSFVILELCHIVYRGLEPSMTRFQRISARSASSLNLSSEFLFSRIAGGI